MGDWNYNARGYEEITAYNVARFFNDLNGVYNATESGCQTIIDQWKEKADRLDERFKNIPGYEEGEHHIILKYAWLRQLDKKNIKRFSSYLGDINVLELAKTNNKTKGEWEFEHSVLRNILQTIDKLPPTLINYHEKIRYKEKVDVAYNNWLNTPRYTAESREINNKIRDLKSFLYSYYDQFVDENAAEFFKENCPKAKIVAGQKMSKAVRKVCAIFGITDHENWEKMYAMYADAINPLQVDKNICISWNLYDYLTMSQGNSWYSCHDIHDVGCYSSGTLSYAEDGVSVVVYMLPDDFKEIDQPIWNIPKVKRQMFHIFEDGHAFVQARLYPDDQTDHGYGTDFSAYESWRHMMQDIISKAFEIPNLWRNKKSPNEIKEYIYTDGTNYNDYNHYDNCNLSYSCNESEIGQIIIGHAPNCPSCGEEHEDNRCCTCEDCREEKITCEDCGQRVRANDAYYINGCYYCENCVTYCEYHEEYEHATEDELTYIGEYGRVCNDGIDRMIEDGYIHECEECGDYSLDRNTYHYDDTENDETYHFCTCRCRDRYVGRNFPRMA